MYQRFKVILFTSILIALPMLVSSDGFFRSGAEKVASEGRMVAHQFRQAYEDDTMGFRSSVEGLESDVVTIFMKHLKEFLNAVCQNLANNPDYKKFSDPICDSLNKMIDTWATKGPSEPQASTFLPPGGPGGPGGPDSPPLPPGSPSPQVRSGADSTKTTHSSKSK